MVFIAAQSLLSIALFIFYFSSYTEIPIFLKTWLLEAEIFLPSNGLPRKHKAWNVDDQILTQEEMESFDSRTSIWG